jgi:tRNA G18 (ribose-2'-O)-methylase SpoU
MKARIIPIHSLEAAELAPYRALRWRNPTRYARRFIAEGDKLVQRLLASRYATESIFVADDYLERLLAYAPADVPIYTAPRAWLEETIGFSFHRGCLACGVRAPTRELRDWQPPDRSRLTAVVCPDVQDPTNLGTILRNCAAFGVDLVLLGGECADPFARRVVRVSMGAVLDLTIVESRALADDVGRLRAEHGFSLAATVLETDAEPLQEAPRPARLALLLGGEGHGLAPPWRAAADRRLTIPMDLGTDSLNVAVASGIFLYHFTRLARVLS